MRPTKICSRAGAKCCIAASPRFCAIASPTAAAEPEAIAHHFTQAGLIDEAIEWWGKAGDQALRRSAFQEAISHLGKAITHLDKPIQMADKAEGGVPAEHTGKRHSRTHLQTTYSYALLHAQGHASLETRAAFDRASELAAGSEDAAERFSAYYGVWSGRFVRAELGPMREASEAFLRDDRLLPGSLDEAMARRIVGTTALFQGDYVGARHHLKQAITAYNPERDRDLVSRFGYDVAVQNQAMLAIVLWALGQFEESESVIRSGLSLSAQTRHNPSMAFAHFYAAILCAIRRKSEHAAAHAPALLAIAREHGMPLWLAHATFLHGWVNWWAGIRAGEAGMREGLRLLRDRNIRHFEPLYGTRFSLPPSKAFRRRRSFPRSQMPRRFSRRSPSSLNNAPISDFVQVFGRRDDEAIHAELRPASEKRQGTKSREVGSGGAAGAMGILPRARA